MTTEIKQEDIKQDTQQEEIKQMIDNAQKIVGKEYTDINGKKYTYRLSQGKRVLKDGKVITFDYKKIYYIRDNGLKRGPKTMTNKKQLRELLTKLSDAKCAEILQYVNEKYINKDT